MYYFTCSDKIQGFRLQDNIFEAYNKYEIRVYCVGNIFQGIKPYNERKRVRERER